MCGGHPSAVMSLVQLILCRGPSTHFPSHLTARRIVVHPHLRGRPQRTRPFAGMPLGFSRLRLWKENL